MSASNEELTPRYEDLDRRIQAYIESAFTGHEDGGHDGQGADGDHAAEFNRLALELFDFQYEHNAAYRRFCRARRVEPSRLSDWTQIPPVPLRAFKEVTLACEPPKQAEAVFMTSGSTDPGRRGCHYHPHLRLYDASLRVNFAHHFLPDSERMRMVVLNPPPEQQPHSSIAYFFKRLVDFFGTEQSDFFVDTAGLQMDRLVAALRECEAAQAPVAVLGTSFAFVHLVDALSERGEWLELPAGSRLLDTGGFKGRSREVFPESLRHELGQRLGLPQPCCVNYYGMTEISTQYYDNALRNAWRGRADEPRHKTVPPWTRIRVIDPETGESVPPGQTGVVVHYDLANRGSCLAVLAEDIGQLVRPRPAHGRVGQTGFVLLGRAEGSEARGCSLAVDELLDPYREQHR